MSLLVFKILKPSSTFHGIDYNERKKTKGKASLLYFNNFMHLQEAAKTINRKDAKEFMDWWCASNRRIRNKQFHAILSCKGKSIDLNRLKDYSLEIMNELGYKDNTILIYGHDDTKHNHVHIITPRIDGNGKKISHHFEKKRANLILNNIIGTDYSKEVKNDIARVFAYHASTLPQYKLLFEQKGYNTKTDEQHLHLYKYGTHQSSISIQTIQEKIKQPFDNKSKQIAALLYNYKKQYSAKLVADGDGKYSTKKKDHQSNLTKFMQQRFGLQFIFFTSGSHTEPYGYLLIDHNQKTVYKGSEVMPLQTLLSDKFFSNIEQREHHENNQKPITDKQNESRQTHHHPQTYIPDLPFESLIDSIEHDVDRDVHNEEHAKKRKKGRFI